MLQATRVWAVLLLMLCVTFLQVQGQGINPIDFPNCTNGDIRLSDGNTEMEGRVEICLENRWGTVCDDGWDNRDAAVVCRQLGFSADGARFTRDALPFGPGEGPIFVESVGCLGTEETLLNCTHDGVRNHDCIHFEDAGVSCEAIGFSCEDGDIRLVGGQSQYDGRVEVCRGNRFGVVCDDQTWNDAEAQVACRQLGFEPEGAIPIGGGEYGYGIGGLHFAGLRCTGEEESFFNCTIRFSFRSFLCSHFDDVGLLCPRPNVTCENGDVRLVNGRTPSEGRVEVCYNGHWGTVCHNGWEEEEAGVVCAELGYERDGAIPIGFADFGRGEGLILLSGLGCNGSESNLAECPHAGIAEHFCGHFQDAGVICPDPNISCVDGDVRLSKGETPNEGLLEVCYNNNFGTVCSDGFDPVDASVVCNQLGYDPSNSIPLPDAYFGEGVGIILLDSVECVGNESHLLDCAHLGFGVTDCFHSFDVSLLCGTTNASCTNGEIRLVNGTGNHSGRVEICFSDRWGTICDDGWGAHDAEVVCRQLGFPTEGAIGLRAAAFGEGTGPIFLANVNCAPENDSTLIECFVPEEDVGVHTCSHAEDAGVVCPLPTHACLNGEIRLVSGETDLEGRVELCIDGRWGTICDTFWSNLDAAVVCRQLGHGPTDAVAVRGAVFGEGEGPIYLDNFFCSGPEEHILDCLHNRASYDNCRHSEDAGVICKRKLCEDNELRLVGGELESEGRVEICQDRQFGTICDDTFDTLDAMVVCRQLGFSGEGAIPLPRAYFGAGTRRVLIDQLDCIGNETSIEECSQMANTRLCFHNEDASVLCQVEGANCTNGELQLVHGFHECEGTVQVCFNGRWGSICDDQWDHADARTVCGLVGCESEGALATIEAYFDTSDGPIFLDQVQCTGTESNILECPSDEPGLHNCIHIEDSGVICQVRDPSFTCEHGAIRLVDGGRSYQGRVEICINGNWGTVCDDNWDDDDASVVCNQLGFGYAGAAAVLNAGYGEGEGDIYITHSRCNGTEDRLIDCPGIGPDDFCVHDFDAGVNCRVPLCEEGDVRLTGGESENEGTVELCVNLRWAGSICDDDWDNADAAVVCRQLGYEGEDAVAVRGSFFGEGPGEIQRTLVGCFGNESDLSECSFETPDNSCAHNDDVGVICPTEEANCTTGDVRLAGGRSEYEGRVEVCLHGRWGTVCDDGWDFNDATVVCNQLGFTDNGFPTALHLSAYGFGTGLIFLDEVQCEGTEETLLGCRTREIGLHNCFHSEDASVICPSPDSACPNGAIRLRRDEGNSTYQGTVEVCLSGIWGSVCADRFWGDTDAGVVCSQLGHSPEGAIAVGNAAFGQGADPIQLRRIHCSGSEAALVYCPTVEPFSFFDFVSCRTHGTDAGVICRDPNFSCTEGELRLRDGATEFEGRVEICSDNLFGTICSSGWDGNNAAVVCGQLGYPTENAIPVSNGYFGTGDGLVHFGSVQCNGTEERLMECEREPNTRCTHILDAGVICQVPNPQCTHGDVRLVDGSTELQGRVEVCVGGRWGTVCDDIWDNTDANVVCGQLGFSRQNSLATGMAFFGRGDGPIFIDQTGCFGNESRLLDCPHSGAGVHDCSHFEDAGAICTEIILCEEGDVRLTGGVSKNEGTVELCVNNEWAGSICDTEWDNADAAVVCRQLGYEGEVAVAVRGSFFGEGPGEIQRTQVGCFGHESDLSKCSFQPANSFCTHDDDVGVICPTEEANCTAGDVRLVGGPTEYEGRVEVCLHGRWGTVCDDAWDNNDARVVCNQLGFTENGSPVHLHLSAYGLGTGLIFLDEVQCEGTEETLLGCRAREIGLHNCFHSEDASVICPSPDSACPNGAIRLRRDEGNSTYQGTVEVCLSGTWGSVCGNQFWEDADARVVCSQLGHSPEGAIAVGDAAFGQGEGPIQLQRPRCSGNETVLVQCPSDPSGFFFDFTSCRTHSSDAGVICRDPSFSCTDGELRLRDGATEFEGRVEICSNNHFGTVCSFDWDEADAVVACRQLGYSTTNAVAVRGGYFGTGIGRIHIASVKCARSEQRLIDCARDGIIGGRCTHSQDAGVICQVPNPECTHGDVRLVGGLTELQGRVEVCVGGRWGSVCDDIWDNTDANVVCGQLGFSPNDSIATDTAFFGRSTGPIFIDETGCFGNESRLLDCPHAGAGVHDCQHIEDAGIICKAKTCTEGATRLVNGVDDYSGRVELCVGGLWGTVCDEKFKTEDANSVCQQQGFKTTGAILTRNAYFGEGEGMIYNSDGTAASDQCSHKSDAGVFCQPSTADSAAQCETGAVRLTGGKTDSEGRVEVCLNGQWGTVCDDSWDDNSAAVVCNQLNLPNGMTTAVLKAGFGEGTGPVFIDDIKCRGNETNILSCPQLPVNSNHDCSHTEDAGIRCQQDTRATKKSTNTAAIVVPIVLIVIIIVVVMIVGIIVILYRRKRSGKFFIRQADEIPITRTESFSSTAAASEAPEKPDLQQYETSGESPL